ncbi:hypothetical protein D5S18_00840 [Nocardia panacis]|uniref:Uncharacterized protein n=1 Tax=Nocardia panacis TaxID=2340916 RepID=A0A3A4K407_9NOCA|nr:hypothetical protein [Nocardia panacis]RJO79854.1 hypothetical protein D5S18_00840 [Nocardia panacis]
MDPQPDSGHRWEAIVEDNWPRIGPSEWYRMARLAQEGAQSLDTDAVARVGREFAAAVPASVGLQPAKDAMQSETGVPAALAAALHGAADVFTEYGDLVRKTQNAILDAVHDADRDIRAETKDAVDAEAKKNLPSRVSDIEGHARATVRKVVDEAVEKVPAAALPGLTALAEALDLPGIVPQPTGGGGPSRPGPPMGQGGSKSGEHPPPGPNTEGTGGNSRTETDPAPVVVAPIDTGNLPPIGTPGTGPEPNDGRVDGSSPQPHDPVRPPSEHDRRPDGGTAGHTGSPQHRMPIDEGGSANPPGTADSRQGSAPAPAAGPGHMATPVYPGQSGAAYGLESHAGQPSGTGSSVGETAHHGTEPVSKATDAGTTASHSGTVNGSTGSPAADAPTDVPGAARSGSAGPSGADSRLSGSRHDTDSARPQGFSADDSMTSVAGAALAQLAANAGPQVASSPAVPHQASAPASNTAAAAAPSEGRAAAPPRAPIADIRPGVTAPSGSGVAAPGESSGQQARPTAPNRPAGLPDSHRDPGARREDKGSDEVLRDAVGAALLTAAAPAFVVGERADGDLVLARTLLRGVLSAVDDSTIGTGFGVAVLRHQGGVSAFLTSNEGRGWLPAGLYLPREMSTPWVWAEADSGAWEGISDPARVLAEFGTAWGRKTGGRVSAIVSSESIERELRGQLREVALEGPVEIGPGPEFRSSAPGLIDRLSLIADARLLDQVAAIPDERIAAHRLGLAVDAHVRVRRLGSIAPDSVALNELRQRILLALRSGNDIPEQWWTELGDADDLLAATMAGHRLDVSRIPLGGLRSDAAGRPAAESAFVRAMAFERRCDELVLLLARAPTRQSLRDAVYAHGSLVGHPDFARPPANPAPRPPSISAGPV